MNIDFHFHHTPEFFLSELESQNPWGKSVERVQGGRLLRFGPIEIPLDSSHWNVERALEVMDERRIDVAAISPSPILFHAHWPAEPVAALHRRVNERMAELRAAHPRRVAPLGILPMQDPKLAMEELDRCMALGLSGVEMETNIAGANLDGPEFRPLWSRLERSGAVVFLHPLMVAGADRLRAYHLTNLIGNPTDTAIAVASLIFGGVLADHPALKVVCAHGGGSAACLCGRWEHGYRVRPELQPLGHSPREGLKMLYFDSLTHSSDALDLLIRTVGADRIVLGSDFPYDMGNERPVEDIEENANLSPTEKEQILGRTAARLLSID